MSRPHVVIDRHGVEVRLDTPGLRGIVQDADVVAEEDCDLMVISRKDFLQRLEREPDIMASVLELVSQRLADTMDIL